MPLSGRPGIPCLWAGASAFKNGALQPLEAGCDPSTLRR